MRKGATVIAMAAALGASGAVGYCVSWRLFGDREPPRAASMRIGAEVLHLPWSYLRVGARSRAESGSVELAVFFPEFKPAGGVDDVTARTDVEDRFERTVFLSIRPAEAGLDPSERPARLYQRFLEEASWMQPGGLIARAFNAGSPFEGDELYYAPPEGRQFAARCRRPDQARKTPNTCVAVFRSGALDVEIRFAAARLGEWAQLIAGAQGLIEAARR